MFFTKEVMGIFPKEEFGIGLLGLSPSVLAGGEIRLPQQLPGPGQHTDPVPCRAVVLFALKPNYPYSGPSVAGLLLSFAG